MRPPREVPRATMRRLGSLHRQVLLCAGVVLLTGGGLLWRYATEDDRLARVHPPLPVGGVVLTLAQNARGEVVATLRNGTREPKEFFTEPQRLEVFEAGAWQLPPPVIARCGNRDIRQEMIGPGAEVTFGIRSDLDQVKQGQPFRVVVYSDGQFKSGVASNSLVLAPRYANNP